MYDKTKYIYVGLDLHKEQHTAVIMGCFNEKLEEITFEKGIAFEGVVFFRREWNCLEKHESPDLMSRVVQWPYLLKNLMRVHQHVYLRQQRG